jgi:hypothetical protein
LAVVCSEIKPPTESRDGQSESVAAAIDRHPTPISALCLSGGGIRSGIFGLGVLQGLKRFGLLQQFHYLSTVSGGGYIGGWLSTWRSVQPDSTVLSGLTALEDVGVDPEEIKGIRADSNYLTPRLGLLSPDTWTVLTLYLRNLFLNWLIFAPFFIGCLLFPLCCAYVLDWVADLPGTALGESGTSKTVHESALWAGSILLCVALSAAIYGRFRMRGRWLSESRFVICVLCPMIVSAMCFCIASQTHTSTFVTARPLTMGIICGCLIYFVSWFLGRIVARPSSDPVDLWDLVAWIVSGGLVGALVAKWISAILPDLTAPSVVALGLSGCVGAYLIGELVYVGASSFCRRGDMDREWLARASGWLSATAVIWLVLSGLALFGPPAFVKLCGWAGKTVAESTFASLGGISGLLTLLLGSSEKTAATVAGRALKRLSLQQIAGIAAVIFAMVLMVVLSLLGQRLPGIVSPDGSIARIGPIPVWTTGWMAGLIVAAFLMSYFVNVNRFSLHALYRNRLSRAFIGSARASLRTPDPFTGFDPRDNVALKTVEPKTSPDRLFHVINAALNVVATRKLAWQERKAESFTFSRLHCGSPIVGFRPTSRFAGARYGGLSLATALAVSGAAVSPNQGYNSSPLICFLLMLFNVRLGWWFGNPCRNAYGSEGPCLGLAPALKELAGATTDDGRWVYLSDGGHFENLGVYEMIRRRCRFIVISDADCDPDFHFQDLGNAARKVFIDFGVSIEFHHLELKPRSIAPPTGCQSTPPTFGARFAIGRIVYPGCLVAGWLLYIKPTYQATEGIGIRSYASQHTSFPHESTADQWFSESQLESYRALGAYLVEHICTGGRGLNALSNPGPMSLDDLKRIAEQYLNDQAATRGPKAADMHPARE